MKIEKFKKLKNGVYELQLDNYDKILTYEEVILKYELLLNKNITPKKLKEIEQLNSYYENYYKALRLINKKAYTRKELYLKLKNDEQLVENVNNVLDELEKQGYLNDKVYSNGYVNNKIITTTHGPNRIKKELSDRGVDSKIISEVMENYTEEIELEKIEKIVKRQLKSNHNKSNNYMIRKIKNELLSEGFRNDLIEQVISNANISDDSDIREKEYNKIKNKLSKKYSGKELEYKIKEKMALKGFYY